MADKKVSQETNLGLGGIDGTVEYRVIKGGSTYKQAYADLFSYIYNNVTIPTLQQVLDNNHDLSPDNFWAGTAAGLGVATANHNIGIGGYAGANNDGGQSISIGYAAGATNANASFAIAIGYNSLNSLNGSSSAPIAIGSSAAANCFDLVETIAIGDAAMSGSTGINNGIAIGYTSLSQSSGNNNIAIGNGAGVLLNSSSVTAIGESAFYNSGININSIGIGSSAGAGNNHNGGVIALGELAAFNSDDDNNSDNLIAIGYRAGAYISNDKTNSYNDIIAIGTSALDSVGNVSNSVALGTGALSNLPGGKEFYDNVIAIGYNAAAAIADSSQTGYTNTVAIGNGAARYSDDFITSIAIGYLTATEATGDGNIYVGVNTGTLSVANRAVYIGVSAGYSDIGSIDNIGIGYNALYTTGATNSIALGVSSLESSSGQYNIAIGEEAGYLNSSAGHLLALGYQAGSGNSGGYVVALGQRAGVNNSGADVVMLGRSAGEGNNQTQAFIIGGSCLKSFATTGIATTYFSSQILPINNYYLYFNSTTKTIEAYKS